MKTIKKFGYYWYKIKGGYLLKEHIDNKSKYVGYLFYSYKWYEDKIFFDDALKLLEI